MKELVSVIIPVYNVENYITTCIESVVNQTYKNLEIILVDDGSRDRSGEICDQYQQLDSRIIVIHQKNGGLSVARNTGLDKAKGKFIAFVDSDDFVHPQFIEILYNNLLVNNCSVSMCDYHRFVDDELINHEHLSECTTMLLTRDEFLLELSSTDQLERDTKAVVVWNKLYRADILKDIRFVPGKIHEDQYFVTDLFPHLETICRCFCTLYEYRTRAGSLSVQSHIDEKSLRDSVEALSIRCARLENEIDLVIYREVVNYYLNFLAGKYLFLQKEMKNYKVCKRFLKKRFRMAMLRYWKYCKAKRYLIFGFSPKLFKKMMHW